MYFVYGDEEIRYLKGKDKKLGEVIEKIGHIDREVDADLFSAVIHHIIGQQISSRALQTIWRRMGEAYGEITAETIGGTTPEVLRSFGMSLRKAEYIKDFAERVRCGAFDLAAVEELPDQEVVSALTSLNGIGVWTAEMILLFCLQRPNVLSYGDLAIQRGMRMVYHHRKIDKSLFEKYRRRLSPYCSVASLYFWAVAGGAVEGMRDYAPNKASNKVGISKDMSK